jgi:hypothetical protein
VQNKCIDSGNDTFRNEQWFLTLPEAQIVIDRGDESTMKSGRTARLGM